MKILVIDVGNTNIVIGAMNDSDVLFEERLHTNRAKTTVEYALNIEYILNLHNLEKKEIEGIIISSVVPQITNIIKKSAEITLGIKAMVINSELDLGLNILMDYPKQVGVDILAGAVGAAEIYQLPAIVIDMGTATTVCVVDENRNYLGGMIIPGVMTSLDSLVSKASQLNGISLDNPKNLIGKNTIDCMTSGAVYGNASLLDGIIKRIKTETNKKYNVIATGGLADLIMPYCEEKVIIDNDLLLKGLYYIYLKNRK